VQNSNYTNEGNIIVNNDLAKLSEENYHVKSFLLWTASRLWASQSNEIVLSFKEVQESAQLSVHTRANKITDFINKLKEKNKKWDLRATSRALKDSEFINLFESIEITEFSRNNFVKLRYSKAAADYLNAKKRYCVLPTKIVLESSPAIQDILIAILVNRYNGKCVITKDALVNNYNVSAANHLSQIETRYLEPIIKLLSSELPDISYIVKVVGAKKVIIFSWDYEKQLTNKEREINAKINNNKTENTNYAKNSADDISDDELIKILYGGENKIWR
jgi:hypothetical protein